MKVVEIFGPTIQGEGPDAGTPCHFVRFGGCDYRCGYVNGKRDERLPFLCDSLHAVLPEHVREAPNLTTEDILAQLFALGGDPRYVVLSGGNPAMQKCQELVDGLHLNGWRVSIETQGTLWKPWINSLDTIVVSPKPPSAGQPFSVPILDNFVQQVQLNERPKQLAMKVPIYSDDDLQFADMIAERYCGGVWQMFLSTTNAYVDQGIQKDDLRVILLKQYEWIIENAQRYEHLTTAQVFPQIHVLVWGEEIGR